MNIPSSKSSLTNHFEFEEHLLTRRLKRLPKDVIERFWEQDLDLSDVKGREGIVNRIVLEYKIKNHNPQFTNKFRDFLRDAVLTAREADYLISVSSPIAIVSWIKSWNNNQFSGQSHTFRLHTAVELNQKYLETNQSDNSTNGSHNSSSKISFPSQVIFLVGSRKEAKKELNGLEIVSFYPTTEFEVIIRKDLDILEIRGPFQVVRDFLSTAILDADNPLSAARSYFIGEAEDVQKSLIKPIAQIIKIDTLKNLLDGAYKKLASPFPGIKVSGVEVTLEGLKDIDEETNPEAKAILKELIKNPVKGNILFNYKNKNYSFTITKTGGLLFREYIPEEVVTYIISLIKLSGNVQNGSQNS